VNEWHGDYLSDPPWFSPLPMHSGSHDAIRPEWDNCEWNCSRAAAMHHASYRPVSAGQCASANAIDWTSP